MFNYAFLIPIFPLLAFALIVFFLNRNNRVSALTAVAGILLSGVFAYGVLFEAIGEGAELAKHPFSQTLPFVWTLPTGKSFFFVGWMIDPLAAVTLFMVTTVCLMIFIYSIGYMQHSHTDEHGHHHVTDDPRYARFFAYISLFACGMLGLVISSNLFELFIFWEIMGLCSYLLIGFWSVRAPNEHHIDDAQTVRAKLAGIKAFLTTRVGDTIFFAGMIFLYIQTKDLNLPEIFNEKTLHHLAEAQALPGVPWVTVIALCILGGAIGKSAQFPLHIWLPDAMEGPTPVSALIHAATMVAAGVYLIARTYPLYITAAEIGGPAMTAVAIVGAFTALFAATIGVAQDDIKRVLAYSTISQLGFMVAALGIGAYVAGAFHLITHAFFKALLFLSAGSVIHGVGTNDMMNMGGLRKKMPITTTVFIIGALALAGIPPLAGFWSKDEILAHAFERGFGEHPDQVASAVFVMLATAAFFTAFYMTRQIFLTFFGEARDHHAVEHAHESPKVMWMPLAVLAFFACVIGFANATPLGIDFFGRFVGEYVLGIKEHLEHTPFNPMIAGLSVGIAVAGIALGWLVYGWHPVKHGQRDPLSRVPIVWTVLRNKYWMDELYGIVIAQKEGAAGKTGKADSVRVQPGLLLYFVGWLSDVCFAFDKWVVDGLVNLAGALGRVFSAISGWIDKTFVDGAVNFVGMITNAFGDALKYVQTGRVQNYLLLAISGTAILVFVFFVMR
jgi:NADH-quinone oxidoreductase subunit L